jgi:uncharacterized SAM-binding protein YcdF (DUF218 family)
MYFTASKIIGFFVFPSNFIPTLIICGLLLWRTRFGRIGKRICVVGILLLLVAGALPIGNALLLPLENRFQPWDSSRGAPTGIIVLGGVIDPEISSRRGEIAVNNASERLFAAVELYHRYPTVRIVLSGGSPNLVFDGPSESELAIQLLERFGIPRKQMEAETSSRNTIENAVNTEHLVMPKAGERWLLITSAYHMPRAIGLFRRAGFQVEAYPVDWQTSGWVDFTTQQFSFMGELENLDIAFHEWIGLIFDRLTGRTSVLLPKP